MITVSLEWAKKLKEVGWVTKTYFAYEVPMDMTGVATMLNVPRRWVPEMDEQIYAPTAEEILRGLPRTLQCDEYFGECNLECGALLNSDKWGIHYRSEKLLCGTIDKKPVIVHADTLANACAAMYVYLSNNNLLS